MVYSKVVDATIASGSNESSAVKVAGFRTFSIELPTASVGLEAATVTAYLSGCETSTGTFRPISNDDSVSITSGSTGNVIAIVDNTLPDYIKINVNTVATAAGYSCKVHAFN